MKIRKSIQYQVIENILKEMVRGSYKINNDHTIDVEGNVYIPERYIKMPVQFGYISGDFICSYTKITSLEGAPIEVDGGFFCNYTNITSLEGAPIEVGGTFNCAYTNITSLKGAPIEVGGNFWCHSTKITSLKGAPREVGGSFYCSDTKITSLEGAPQEVHGRFDCRYIFETEPDHSFINIGGHLYWS